LLRKERKIRNPLIIIFVSYPEDGVEKLLRDDGARIRMYVVRCYSIRTYGIELRGCSCKSNIEVIQRCQSKILRAIVDAPWYVTKDMIHKYLSIPTVHEVIHDRSIKHRTKLESHSNPLLPTPPTKQHHTKTEKTVAN